MPEQHQSLLRRLLRFRWLVFINAGVLLVIGYSFGREWMRNREIQQEIARLQDQAESLQAQNLRMAELNTAFRTQSFIEREARLKLGLKRPGESVVVVQGGQDAGMPGSEEAGTAPTATGDPRAQLAREEAAEERRVANPAKWWQYFFD